MYTIKYITGLPTSLLVSYVRRNVPEGVHFRLTLFELKLLVVRMMDYRGMLTDRDSRILRTPLIGKAYVASNGDLERAFERVAVDALPGSTLLRFL